MLVTEWEGEGRKVSSLPLCWECLVLGQDTKAEVILPAVTLPNPQLFSCLKELDLSSNGSLLLTSFLLVGKVLISNYHFYSISLSMMWL